jgi:hypothetical protein
MCEKHFFGQLACGTDVWRGWQVSSSSGAADLTMIPWLPGAQLRVGNAPVGSFCPITTSRVYPMMESGVSSSMSFVIWTVVSTR